MKTVDVKTETIISVPIEKVSSYASNPDNAPEWYVNIKSAEWKTSKPLTVGSQIVFKARFLGRQLEYVYEVCSGKETCHADCRRPLSYGDDLHLGEHGQRTDTHDFTKHRTTRRILKDFCTHPIVSHEKSKHQRLETTETDS